MGYFVPLYLIFFFGGGGSYTYISLARIYIYLYYIYPKKMQFAAYGQFELVYLCFTCYTFWQGYIYNPGLLATSSLKWIWGKCCKESIWRWQCPVHRLFVSLIVVYHVNNKYRSKWTRVVEEIMTYGNLLHSTYCRTFPLVETMQTHR